MTQFHHIITLKYNEAIEVAALIRKGKYKAAIDYLSQWDYGFENEHSPYKEKPWGGGSKTYTTGRYTLVWDFAIDDSVSLYRSERVRKA